MAYSELATLTEKKKNRQEYNAGEFFSSQALHQELDAESLIRSNDSVVQYWSSHNDKREIMYDFRKGKHWTPEELQLMRWKNKAPVVFNKIISAVRTIVGTFIQNRYDIKPAPFTPDAQDISDVISHRYHWNAHHTMVRYLDTEIIQEAVVGGDAWQESYIEVVPGKKPRICVINQNAHAVYADPNSRDLVNRFDCEFIDRRSWLTLGEMCDRWPERRADFIRELGNFDSDNQTAYEPGKKYADRTHETQWQRNGRFLHIERFYKVHKKVYYSTNEEGKEFVFGTDDDGTIRANWKKKHPEAETYSRSDEFLFLAVVCPAYRLTQFLQNEPYFNQPKCPVTGRVMFTLIQLYAEQLDGETNGYVEYMVGPNKVINSMMANKLHAAKHAVNTSLIYDPSKINEDDAEDFEKHAADGDRRFKSKPGVDPNSVAATLPQGRSAPDTNESLDYANAFQEEVSGAPPASRGVAEGNVAASLNQQRIEQAFIQLATFTESYKLFLTKRAKLWNYYDRVYFTEEETFRVIEKKEATDPDFITVNQWQMDQYGIIKKANDIGAAAYDIVFEDSYRSPTVRDKVMKQIVELQQSNAVQQDPVLNTFLTMYFLKMSDAPQDLKDFAKDHSAVVKQWNDMKQMQQQRQGDLANTEQLQKVAQAEAEQAGGGQSEVSMQQPEPAMPQVQIPQSQAAMAAG